MTAPDATARPTNRLSLESSPYLRQHAHNPVDWYPWGNEALSLARSLDRPIFLSIGYSACHWCHVMERESFESVAIAQLMNDWFINIKVDREERPDLDQIYMDAVVAMTNAGGWPMSVFLLPDGRPFYGGTYWPPTSRWGRPGFADVLTAIHDAWTTRRAEIEAQATDLTSALQRQVTLAPLESNALPRLLRSAQEALLKAADRVHGGFGKAPKFLHTLDLRLLLRTSVSFDNPEAQQVATLTLDRMARGGLYDQLGGGFARYSTDERWLVPHFEKMLYDNALLVPAYIEAWQQTARAEFATVATETIEFVLRDLTSPEGTFYSTLDADSEGVEGKYYVWSRAEVDSLLGDDADLFCSYYDVTTGGNWEHTNILNRPFPHDALARARGLSSEELSSRLLELRQRLLAVRALRVPPGRDDKVLVGWNGLMVSALAIAGRALQNTAWLDAATRAVDDLKARFVDEAGRLLHTRRIATPPIRAFQDDYACLIAGLIALYQSAGRPGDLAWAAQLADEMIALFYDGDDTTQPARGQFYLTPGDHESLIARPDQLHDNATPSGNNVAMEALFKLARLTGRDDFDAIARSLVARVGGLMERAPMAMGQALLAIDFDLGPSPELVFCPGKNDAENAELRRHAGSLFLPRALWLEPSADNTSPGLAAELLQGKVAVEGEPTLYVCQRGACERPAVGANAIRETLTRLVTAQAAGN